MPAASSFERASTRNVSTAARQAIKDGAYQSDWRILELESLLDRWASIKKLRHMLKPPSGNPAPISAC